MKKLTPNEFKEKASIKHKRQIINNFKHFNYIGVPILKKTKNTEILTVNPVNYIQQLMKDFHAPNRN